MPQESNTKAAEGTRSAAKAHLTAAEHHGRVITPRPVSIRRRRTGTQTQLRHFGLGANANPAEILAFAAPRQFVVQNFLGF